MARNLIFLSTGFPVPGVADVAPAVHNSVTGDTTTTTAAELVR